VQATSCVVQWGSSHVWKAGDKVFAIGGWEINDAPAFTFKASEFEFIFMQDEQGFRAALDMASRGMKCIQNYDSSQLINKEIENYVRESHRIVFAGLTKKTTRAWVNRIVLVMGPSAILYL